MGIYLIELIRSLEIRIFSMQLFRAGIISFFVFLIFAWIGERVFEDLMQVRFLAFMIFGGITFLIIGVRLILGHGPPVESLRPGTKDYSGTIAMPFLIGPGTISASVITGSRLDLPLSSLAIGCALACAIGAIIMLKMLYDFVHSRNEKYVERYIDIAGRVTALFTGSFAVEMILKGFEKWKQLL